MPARPLRDLEANRGYADTFPPSTSAHPLDDLSPPEMFDDAESQMRAQDARLDDLAKSISTQLRLSRHIGSTLESQSVMIDEFTAEVDQHGNNIAAASRRVDRIAEEDRFDSRSWTIIAVLVVVLILLVAVL